MDILPLVQFYYHIGEQDLDYVNSQRDLGVLINSTLTFTEQALSLYSKANQNLVILKRTCHFVKSQDTRRVLYLILVRSIFGHCPVIWRPSSDTVVNKLESIQKRAFKGAGGLRENYSEIDFLVVSDKGD